MQSTLRSLVRVAVLCLSIVSLEGLARAGSCTQFTTAPPFCSPDVVTPCPCDNPPYQGQPGHGCPNSFTPNGAFLSINGGVGGCNETLQLTAVIGGNAASFALALKGDASVTPVASGDGLRCVGGQLIRFGGHNAGTNGAPLGTWTFPNSVQPGGVPIQSQSGLWSIYQVYYRNVQPFCNGSTTNWTNAVAVQPWF